MIRHADQSGFTLVEVIFASGILTACTALVVSSTVNTLLFSHEEQMQNAIERETTIFLEYFNRDILGAAAACSDYPAASRGAKCMVLKVPEFDEFGVHTQGVFDYVLYEYFPETGRAVRTVYDDDLGEYPLWTIEISAGDCDLSYFADGKSLSAYKEFEPVKTLQLSASRYEKEHGLEYSRNFVTALTLRNLDK